MTPLLEVSKLVKRFGVGGRPAVDDVSLIVEPGTFVTILGPSGSGKSTTLMMVAGFETPTAGRIAIAGRDVTRVPAHGRDLGVVFQSYALFPHLTVFENVAFPLRVRRKPASQIATRTMEVLALVKLEAFAARHPRHLSGGQQQRVAVARALVHSPPMLLMDEPLGALDRHLRSHMQFELKALQGRLGITVLYVTHDQEEAMAMSDVLVVMNQGRIEQQGTPRGVYERPETAFVATFLGDTNLLSVTRSGPHATVPDLRLDLPCFPGSTQQISLRPERIRIVPPEQGMARGRVLSSVFLGEAMRTEVVTASGRTLLIRHPVTLGQAGAAPDTEIGLQIDLDDAVPLRGNAP
jgi:putative spermidine/putrescine transport system ATP-binding protein